jgi:hypothetical protein
MINGNYQGKYYHCLPKISFTAYYCQTKSQKSASLTMAKLPSGSMHCGVIATFFIEGKK